MAALLIRIGVFLLAAAAVGIALVPILVLIDLLDGGTGWGLCPRGLEACANPYTAVGELIILLSLGLFVCVMGIRALMRLARRLRRDEYQVVQ